MNYYTKLNTVVHKLILNGLIARECLSEEIFISLRPCLQGDSTFL